MALQGLDEDERSKFNMYTHTLLESRKEALDKLPDFQKQLDNTKEDSAIAETQ